MKVILLFCLCVYVTSATYAQSGQISRHSKYHFALISPNAADPSTYEDSYIKVSFQISRWVNFILKNKTSSPIKIIWNDATITTTDGVSHSVVHKGVKYIGHDQVLRDTQIRGNASRKDLIVPTDYVLHFDKSMEQFVRSMFPANKKRDNNNKKFSIMLPLYINSEKKVYTFEFNVSVY